MVVYKDIALNLRVINEALIKDYADKEELESIMPHLLGTGKDVLKGLYEITFLMQERGPIERWKIISLDLEIGRYISRITETHLIDNEADEKEDAFISMLRGIYTMCTRYVEMLMEFDGNVILDGTIVNYKKEHPTKEVKKVEYRQDRAKIDGLITDKVKKYYTRAINEGWIIETGYGYRWKWGEPREKARLGYFIKKAYDPDGFGVIPYKALETLFGVKRLDSTIYQLVGGKPKWQDEIDNKVFYD